MNWDWAKGIFFSSFGVAFVLCISGLSALLSFLVRWATRKLKPSYDPNRWFLFAAFFILIFNSMFINEETTFIGAHAGRSHSQLQLGWWYSRGMGFINQSDQKAFYWFMQASNQGNIQAQKYLGYAYEKGKGTPKNLDQAIFWYTKACQAGDKSAGDRLLQIANSARPTNQSKSEPSQ